MAVTRDPRLRGGQWSADRGPADFDAGRTGGRRRGRGGGRAAPSGRIAASAGPARLAAAPMAAVSGAGRVSTVGAAVLAADLGCRAGVDGRIAAESQPLAGSRRGASPARRGASGGADLRD